MNRKEEKSALEKLYEQCFTISVLNKVQDAHLGRLEVDPVGRMLFTMDRFKFKLVRKMQRKLLHSYIRYYRSYFNLFINGICLF